MDERFVKKLIVSSFVIVVLSNVFFYELKYLIDRIFFKKKHFLIVGILSAPENFEQRLSLRKTWLQLISDISGSYYFAVGNEICEVPLLDRPDPFTCISRPFVLPQNVTAETEFSTMKIQIGNSESIPISVPNFVGFGFYVRSKIRVRKLGILRDLLSRFKSEVQVKLISAFDKNVLASVTFCPAADSESNPEILLKSIKPIQLVEFSEALVRLEGREVNEIPLPDCRSMDWVDEPQVINYITLWQGESIIPTTFSKKSCTYVLMTYSIVDMENVKKSIRNRHLRLKEWRGHNRKLSIQLNNESKIYNDIVFLDVVDVYRNISMKLAQFYKRILEQEYFQYLLKTDDDSFIDLLRVYNQLKAINKEMDEELGFAEESRSKERRMMIRDRLSNFWCWSYFREFWKVQHSGKWRDSQYRSASYPSFPCGGGYVVNKGIVDYVASNEHNLNYFQGEDVSMGIWMSSLPVIHYRTPNVIADNESVSHELQKKILTKFKGKQFWLKLKRQRKSKKLAPDFCEWNCGEEKKRRIPACNRVQMSVESMYDTWNDYINRGFL